MEYSEYLESLLNGSREFRKPKFKARKAIFNNVKKVFERRGCDAFILDCACGDGTSLRQFNRMGFRNVTGVELHPRKVAEAKQWGYDVVTMDIHQIGKLKGMYDVIYSANTLQYAFIPKTVLLGFKMLLRRSGELVLILPYVDIQPNYELHCGSQMLGLNKDDGYHSFTKFVSMVGFTIKSIEKNQYKPEILVKLKIQ